MKWLISGNSLVLSGLIVSGCIFAYEKFQQYKKRRSEIESVDTQGLFKGAGKN